MFCKKCFSDVTVKSAIVIKDVDGSVSRVSCPICNNDLILNYNENISLPIKIKPITFPPIDYSKKENQIGCGYCEKEEICKIRDPKINKAKLGCPDFEHYLDARRKTNHG